MAADDSGAVANARKLCAELLAEFKDVQLDSKMVNRRLLPVAFAWTTQVHRFVEAALELQDRGFGHEAIVLQRQAIEFTVRLHWLCKLGDAAVDTLLDENRRSMETLADDAAGGPLGIPAGFLDELRGTAVDPAYSFGSFQAACDAFGLRDSLYSLYRHLSKHVHPTWAAANTYLVEQESVIGVRHDPGTNFDTAPVMLAALLVWSQRSIDDLINGKPRRRRLRQAARSLRVVPVLPHMTAPPKKARPSRSRPARK